MKAVGILLVLVLFLFAERLKVARAAAAVSPDDTLEDFESASSNTFSPSCPRLVSLVDYIDKELKATIKKQAPGFLIDAARRKLLIIITLRKD